MSTLLNASATDSSDFRLDMTLYTCFLEGSHVRVLRKLLQMPRHRYSLSHRVGIGDRGALCQLPGAIIDMMTSKCNDRGVNAADARQHVGPELGKSQSQLVQDLPLGVRGSYVVEKRRLRGNVLCCGGLEYSARCTRAD